ncbi:RND family efflux transporter, MFP subunit [Frateuria terrea]|uniref:RND family efflux transporter, MFP subunit n=1 Tax=Frateuria terrea TaxID=529704 RepID=A0A1H6UIP0_9GAMM|nr:RND family efflux transporter, MFP subunit [Frateuria terrea]SFP37930.1 RND family efflux transporter, MFP subunit [Frateuria terrea]
MNASVATRTRPTLHGGPRKISVARKRAPSAAAVVWLALCGLGLSGAVDAQDAGPADAAGHIRTQLAAQHDVEISSEVAAKIARLPLKEGDAFAKGGLLVAFDCGLYQAQLAKAEATAEAARREQDVTAKLAALHSAGAMDVVQAKARAKEAAADAAYMRTTVDKCTIRAPFAGRVAKREAAPFEYVTPGKPLLEILATGALEVKLIVPSKWLAWLRPGAKFTVHVDELGTDYPAQVARLGANIDPVSQTVGVSGRILDAHAELLPGMSGWASFAGHAQ